MLHSSTAYLATHLLSVREWEHVLTKVPRKPDFSDSNYQYLVEPQRLSSGRRAKRASAISATYRCSTHLIRSGLLSLHLPKSASDIGEYEVIFIFRVRARSRWCLSAFRTKSSVMILGQRRMWGRTHYAHYYGVKLFPGFSARLRWFTTVCSSIVPSMLFANVVERVYGNGASVRSCNASKVTMVPMAPRLVTPQSLEWREWY